MRYLKVLLTVVFFYLVMLFFVQNQDFLSQSMPLKFDLMFLPPIESGPIQFNTLALIAFLLGGLCSLCMLLWDRLTLSGHLHSTNRRLKAMEAELSKSVESLENIKKELDAAVKRADEAETRANQAEQDAQKARGETEWGVAASSSHEIHG